MKRQQQSVLIVVAGLVTLTGCAVASSIKPVSSSKSAFDGAVYDGETTVISQGTRGNEEFRVFDQGATSFVPLQAVRSSAEDRATVFCERKGKAMNPLSETAASLRTS